MIWTTILSFFQQLAINLEPLEAPFVSWINANLPANESIHEIKRVKMFCRHAHLTGEDILTQVKLAFPTQTPDMQTAIAKEITDSLANTKK